VGAVALAVHPGALGDVLLAVPALRALRAAGAPVVLAAQPHLGALLTALGVVDDHVAFDALGLDALFVDDDGRRARLPPVDRLVCWFGARDPVFVRRLGALVPGAVIAPSVVEGRAVWEHLLATVDPRATPEAWCTPITAPDALRALGATPLAKAPPPWLIVHPGAGSAAKCWPAAAFARVVTTVAARARMNVLAHRGPADDGPAAALRRHLGAGLAWLEEPALPALAGVLAGAHAYLGNDSGVSHLAAALGVPSLVLFDRRHLAWRPWWTGARVCPVGLGAMSGPPVESEIEAVIAGVLELFA
jgi:ADP-heptose:LPS heptosyltransferase